jgi:hypothetical protein
LRFYKTLNKIICITALVEILKQIFNFCRHCGIKDPSWSELHHFVSFLNKQLQYFEVSVFCAATTGQEN